MGWRNIHCVSQSIIIAKRFDEIGQERVLRIKFVKQWDDSLLESGYEKWDIIACPSGFPDRAISTAENRSIGLLDEEVLQRIEKALV